MRSPAERGRGASRTRQRLATIALVLVSCLATFVAAEFLARLLLSGPEVGWSRTASVPARAAATATKPGGSTRAVALGDSFTIWGEDAGLSYLRVAQRAVPGLDAVNLAEAGTGLCAYYDTLVSLVPALQPDWIVIGLYLGNDLAPCALATRTAAVPVEPEPSLTQWLRENSVLLTLGWRLCKNNFAFCRSGTVDRLLEERRREAGWSEADLQARLAELDPELLGAARADAINHVDLVQGVFAPDHYGEVARAEGAALLAAVDDLVLLAEQARSQGARVVVLLLPAAPWVGEDYRDYFRRLGYRDLGPAREDVAVIALLRSRLEARQIVVLDLLPLLRAAGEPVYLPLDTHLNRRGQEIVGKALADLLRAGT
jgi:hypothetical protein